MNEAEYQRVMRLFGKRKETLELYDMALNYIATKMLDPDADEDALLLMEKRISEKVEIAEAAFKSTTGFELLSQLYDAQIAEDYCKCQELKMEIDKLNITIE